VKKTPCWPISWANVSLLKMAVFYWSAFASSHLWGQHNTVLARSTTYTHMYQTLQSWSDIPAGGHRTRAVLSFRPAPLCLGRAPPQRRRRAVRSESTDRVYGTFGVFGTSLPLNLKICIFHASSREMVPTMISCSERMSEKDTKLTQKLGQLQPFMAVFPPECVGQLASSGPT
jgi:hypothetical protein